MKICNLALRRNIGSGVIWAIVLGILFSLIMVAYPTFGTASVMDSLTARAAGLPLIVQEILGLQTMPDFTQMLAYFGYFFQIIVLISAIYGGIVGARALAPEESHGTIEFLYGQPLSRTSIAVQKYIAAVIGYLVYVVLLLLIISAAVFFIDRTQGISQHLLVLSPALGGVFATGMIFLTIGFFFSALLRSGGESIPLTLAVVLICFILGLMGSIVAQVSFIGYISPMHIYDPYLLIQVGFNWFYLIGSIIFVVAMLVLSTIVYKKKDFLFS